MKTGFGIVDGTWNWSVQTATPSDELVNDHCGVAVGPLAPLAIEYEY